MSSAISGEEAQHNGYVLGLQTGRIEARLDLDEFVLDRDVLNLFLLALIKLQENDSYKEPWSWYQISGIHGRPFTNWDNVGSKPVKHDETHHTPQAAGYCSHSSVTFPTWHRPYVAMMEQAVYVAMLKTAKDFKDHDTQESYLNACARFRFPYWDPCLPRQTINQADFGVPKIVSSPSVYVRMPDSPEVLTPVNNPLYAFNFPTAVQSLDNSDFSWGQDSNVLLRTLGGNKHTVRAPDENGDTDDGYINTYISRHIQSDIGSSLYKVLNIQQSWATFSNDVLDNSDQMRHQDGRGNKIYHSVEGFHDNVHGFLGQGRLEGGSGHIGHPQIAAFDPIFWLHHCNMDRITALWQAKLGPHDSKSWWEQQAAGESNWTIPKGAPQTPSDSLIPFRHPKSSPGHEMFWTSDDVRDWKKLGYTYLGKRVISGNSGQNELITFPIDLENTSSANLNAFSGQFYGWMDNAAPGNPSLIRQFYPIDLSNVEALTGKPSPERPSLVRAHPSRIPSNQTPDANKPDYSHLKGLLTHNGKLRQWNINLQAEKFKFEGTFQILVFLGDFSPNPNHWPTEPNLVGIDVIFSSNPHSGGCSNCEQQASAGLVVTDVLPLTSHLIKWIRSGEKIPLNDPEAVGCRSLEYEDVYPFLTKNLHWRIADMNLNHRVQVPGIKLCAVDQEVYLPKTFEESPVFGEINIHGDTKHNPEEGAGGTSGSKPQPESKESNEEEKTRGCCGCVLM